MITKDMRQYTLTVSGGISEWLQEIAIRTQSTEEDIIRDCLHLGQTIDESSWLELKPLDIYKKIEEYYRYR